MSASDPRVGVIAAVSPEGVIGRDGRLPWHRPADLRRFKRLTLGSTVVMGRRTFESIGKPLPDRRNLVVTRSSLPGCLTVPSLAAALAAARGSVWIIGGARLFAEALAGPAELVDLTLVPDRVPVPGSVLFPELDPERWMVTSLEPNADDPALWHRRYRRADRSPRTAEAEGPRPASAEPQRDFAGEGEP